MIPPPRQQQTWIGNRRLEVDGRPATAPCHRPWRGRWHQHEIAGREVEAGAVIAFDTGRPLDHLAEHDDVGGEETDGLGVMRLDDAPEDGLRLEQGNDLRKRIHLDI